MKHALRTPDLFVVRRIAAALVALALLVATPALARTTAVSVDLEPRHIGVDDWAELNIEVEGDGDGVPSVPSIDGLRFEYAGQSSRLESVNGHVRIAQTYHLRVRPGRVGTFRIDPQAFRVGAVQATGDVLELRVEAGSPRGAPTARPHAMAPTDRDGPGDVAPQDEPFLRVVPENERPFVGELVPLRVEAWFPEGVRASLDSRPRVDNTAFTLETPDHDGRVQRRLHEGRVYNVLTWHAALVGVKEGVHPLPLEVEATLQIPDRRPRKARGARRGFGGSLLDDDFFGGGSLGSMLMDDPFFGDSLLDSFFGRTISKSVTLRAELPDVEVRALPAEGRPPAFGGAVGSFELALGPVPARASVGDPIQIETTVSGLGNFARVAAPSLDDDASWKSYEAEGTFEAADDLGTIGRKRFRHTLVARDPSTEAVPPLVFAYFDPLEERYEVLTTPPQPIDVDGTARRPAEPVIDEPVSATQEPLPPLDPRAGADYVPLIFRSWFRSLVAAALAGMAAGLALVVLRRRSELDPLAADRRRAARAVLAARADIDAAYRAADSDAFLDASRRALQHRLAIQWNEEPGAITAADVRRRCPGLVDVAAIFDAADASAFGGRRIDRTSLALWKERVAHALDAVESAS